MNWNKGQYGSSIHPCDLSIKHNLNTILARYFVQWCIQGIDAGRASIFALLMMLINWSEFFYKLCIQIIDANRAIFLKLFRNGTAYNFSGSNIHSGHRISIRLNQAFHKSFIRCSMKCLMSHNFSFPCFSYHIRRSFAVKLPLALQYIQIIRFSDFVWNAWGLTTYSISLQYFID
jgi:hypothetical protein